MKDELKYAISMIGLGASLVTYAHFNFASKDSVLSIEKKTEGLATKEDFKELKNDFGEMRKEIIDLYRSKK